MGTPEARAALKRAAGILRGGGLVALPTETVYGLGANALDRAAVERVFAAKSRPAWDPVIVCACGVGGDARWACRRYSRRGAQVDGEILAGAIDAAA
ncbi:MAG: Sua5/YciO/YrdC/YwlC family protein [Terracidiphilus sp.]